MRARGALSHLSALQLAIPVVEALVERSAIDPSDIEEMYFGTVLHDPRVPNLAREIVLRSTLPPHIQAHSVSNNCITGLTAIALAAARIRSGKATVVVVGGTESMSQPALTFRPAAQRFFLALAGANKFTDKIGLLRSFRPDFLLPETPSPREPSTGLTMGEHCEITTKELGIARNDQDAWALRSHQMSVLAQNEGFFDDEIVPFGAVTKDNLPRADTSLERLSRLRPVFDKSSLGSITAGNASALTDGASALLLMEREAAEQRGIPILALIEDEEFSAIAPADGLLMAPVRAVAMLMARSGLTFAQFSRVEIHEAFAAQVLATLKAWRDGWSRISDIAPLGEILDTKINQRGGSLALGHPFAATGGRIALSLAKQLSPGERGLISICAAGAMGGCMVLRKP